MHRHPVARAIPMVLAVSVLWLVWAASLPPAGAPPTIPGESASERWGFLERLPAIISAAAAAVVLISAEARR